jgi:hypothetical protein
VTGMPCQLSDRAGIEAEIDRVRSLGVDALRSLWRTTFHSSPPPGFTKDLIARFLSWHIQEQAFGGLDPKIAKLLDGLSRGDNAGADRLRRLKPGTVLLREYQGNRHTVTFVPNGYLWGETTYTSLSTIARAITGTAWNGPRFFGLRSVKRRAASSGVADGPLAAPNGRPRARAPRTKPGQAVAGQQSNSNLSHGALSLEDDGRKP